MSLTSIEKSPSPQPLSREGRGATSSLSPRGRGIEGEGVHTYTVALPNSSTGAAFGAFLPWKAHQCLSFIVLCCCIALAAHAQLPTPEMAPMSPELEVRLKKLETELRCLVCQNQTLAESPAGLAGDLRREIRTLADQNKSNEEIKEHLRARYGDFVLYRPPVDGKTWLLWFGPFVLLIGGAMLLWIMNRRRASRVQATPVAPVGADVLARANAMLKDE